MYCKRSNSHWYKNDTTHPIPVRRWKNVEQFVCLCASSSMFVRSFVYRTLSDKIVLSSSHSNIRFELELEFNVSTNTHKCAIHNPSQNEK